MKPTKEEQQEIDYTLNHYQHFEDYCGACDNLDTPNCPFKDKVDYMTEWKKLNCKSFWD